MNSLNSVLSGLLSSLFLSLGFRQLAARLDPLNHDSASNVYAKDGQTLSALACAPCRSSALPCAPCRLSALPCAPCRWQGV